MSLPYSWLRVVDTIFIYIVGKKGIFTRSPLLWVFYPLSFCIIMLLIVCKLFVIMYHKPVKYHKIQFLLTHKVDTEDTMVSRVKLIHINDFQSIA